MKRAKKLIVMAAAAALLAAVYLIINAIVKKNESSDEEPETESYAVAEMDPEKLTSLSIKQVDNPGGETKITNLEFRLKSDKTGWLWTGDESVPLSNDGFTGIVVSLTGTSSPVRMTGVTAEELSSYGLDNPSVESVFGFSDGTSFTCRLGSLNPFNGMYYYSCSADDAVYMVSADVFDSMNVTIFDMVQYDTLPSVIASNIKSLTYRKGSDTLVYTYYPSGNPDAYTDAYNWYLSVNGGKEYPVSAEFGEDISAAVSGRTLTSCVAYNKSNDGEFGMTSPSTLLIDYMEEKKLDEGTDAEKTVTVPASYTLYFGGLTEMSDYYVRTPDSDLIYTLGYSDVFYDMFEEDGSDIRPEELINPSNEFIDEIVFTGGGKTLDVTVAHADTTTSFADKSGAEMNYTAYSALADRLSELRAASHTDFVERDASAGTDAVFTADYTFNRGTDKNLKLEILKYSQSYCQVRFNGREDQLITVSDAEGLVTLLQDYFTAG